MADAFKEPDRKLVADYVSLVLNEFRHSDIGLRQARETLATVIEAAACGSDFRAVMRDFLRGFH